MYVSFLYIKSADLSECFSCPKETTVDSRSSKKTLTRVDSSADATKVLALAGLASSSATNNVSNSI